MEFLEKYSSLFFKRNPLRTLYEAFPPFVYVFVRARVRCTAIVGSFVIIDNDDRPNPYEEGVKNLLRATVVETRIRLSSVACIRSYLCAILNTII